MKVVCLIQARVGSTRLPGKILKNVCGKTILNHEIDRLKKCKEIDEIVVATTNNINDDEVVNHVKNLSVKYFFKQMKSTDTSYSSLLKTFYPSLKSNSPIFFI